MKRSQWAARLGYTDGQWETARTEVREAIIEAARFRRLITYSEVAARVTVIAVSAHGPLLAHLLGEVLGEAMEEDLLALTAIVVHAADQRPGGGFCKEARRNGAVFSDPDEYWIGQVRAVFEWYGAKAPHSPEGTGDVCTRCQRSRDDLLVHYGAAGFGVEGGQVTSSDKRARP
jgi:hypothetical protein